MSSTPPRPSGSPTTPLTPGKWFDSYLAAQDDCPQQLSRSQRANRRRKDNRQRATLESNLKGERNLQQEHHLKRRSSQLQRQAKRQFAEGLKKAKLASSTAANSRSLLKNQFNGTQASLDHRTNSSVRQESRQHLARADFSVSVAQRYSSALALKKTDQPLAVIPEIDSYNYSKLKHDLLLRNKKF
jgi:hypothetical protein